MLSKLINCCERRSVLEEAGLMYDIRAYLPQDKLVSRLVQAP